MENLLSDLVDTLAGQKSKFYGVTVGRVIDPVDPMLLGRVQVQLPMIDSLDLSPWARVATPMAGIAAGIYFIPNVGDEVLVAFENGDLNVPYILGSLWNATAPPPLPSPVPQIRMIRTIAGNTLMFSDVPPTITILTPSGQTIEMSPAGIQIIDGVNVISTTPDGVTITGPNLNLVGTASITVTAPNISITGASSASLQSGGVCSVTAPLVKIN